MYETMILTIEVEAFPDGRKLAENVENEKFESHTDLLNKLMRELGKAGERYNDYNIQVWTLTDFMDACNDQEINLVNVWISYIHLKKA